MANEIDTLIAILNNDTIQCTKCKSQIPIKDIPILRLLKRYDRDVFIRALAPKFLCDKCEDGGYGSSLTKKILSQGVEKI